ncbi:hypothetical protein PVAP13_6KG124735 [Panicum virgatum]|uniref:Uncharacterized protein n=1 Tax=Panicum virgatum TaxID=38727 RepID=A0A8T0RAL3_PANVG|nr:hypothetical protein PVAP13_6KG124735 [Panicum virgatum]
MKVADSANVVDDPYGSIYQNLLARHKLREVPDCRHCGAKRFQYEPPGLCCRKGKVNIHIPEVPAELKRLFTSQVHDDAKYFRKHILYFNSHFSFTSLGVTLDHCSRDRHLHVLNSRCQVPMVQDIRNYTFMIQKIKHWHIEQNSPLTWISTSSATYYKLNIARQSMSRLSIE